MAVIDTNSENYSYACIHFLCLYIRLNMVNFQYNTKCEYIFLTINQSNRVLLISVDIHVTIVFDVDIYTEILL